MSKRKSNSSRRKLLKSIAAGSGAVVAGKSLPESWSKPVINAVMLPAHAATTDDTGLLTTDTQVTRVCCEGVFCRLSFDEKIYGIAQVTSDCTITMQGGSRYGDWSGSGTVAADGSFSFSARFEGEIDFAPPVTTSRPTTTPRPSTTIPPSQRQIGGTVTSDCASISGTVEGFGAFRGTVTPGATSMDACPR